jgi:GNAT superfamily N-acetyltransferase
VGEAYSASLSLLCVRHHSRIVVELPWTVAGGAPRSDPEIIAHGRAQALDRNAEPISCLVGAEDRVVAGATGRTGYERLFVSYLWVSEPLRGQGCARRILAALGSEAEERGCKDFLIETLDDSEASL